MKIIHSLTQLKISKSPLRLLVKSRQVTHSQCTMIQCKHSHSKNEKQEERKNSPEQTIMKPYKTRVRPHSFRSGVWTPSQQYWHSSAPKNSHLPSLVLLGGSKQSLSSCFHIVPAALLSRHSYTLSISNILDSPLALWIHVHSCRLISSGLPNGNPNLVLSYWPYLLLSGTLVKNLMAP